MSLPPSDDLPPVEPGAAPEPERRRSWAWPIVAAGRQSLAFLASLAITLMQALPWLVIIGLVAFMVFGREVVAEKKAAQGEDTLGALLLKVQGRYLVGAQSFLGNQNFYEAAKAFRKGGVDQRLRFVILAGELSGPEDALKELKELDRDMAKHKVQATAEQKNVHDILERLYRERSRALASSISRQDRQFLRDRLEWFGELALAPADLPAGEAEIGAVAGAAPLPLLAEAKETRARAVEPAWRTFALFFGGFMGMALVALGGFVGLILVLVMAASGNLRSGVRTGTGHGSIYAETFAVWFALYIGMLVGASYLELELSPLLVSGVLMFLSLSALAWPVLRGIPWRQVRQDVGLTLGREPMLEPLLGLACYAMTIPLVVGGLIVTLILIHWQQGLAAEAGNPFAPSGYPTHPIVGYVANGGLHERLLVLFLASVAAPLVEETFFRGVLYRHLREASASLGPVLSVLASATFVSFIFAVIHPQGLVAVPVLMALAFGFALAREWRGTLIPGMVGHALNNGMVMLLLSVALGD